MKQLVAIPVIACAASALLAAQAAPPASSGPAPAPLWSLSGEFASPESAYFHAATNAIFVSNINGTVTEKDGNGYISRLNPDGTIVAARWVAGLNAPKGLRASGGTLWAADIDEVVGIDIATARITSRVRIEGAQFLNDLATAPDGTVYVTDSFGARIYQVKDGKASVFVEGPEVVETGNGVLVDGRRLVLGTIGPAGAFGGGARGGGARQGAGGPPPAARGQAPSGGAPPGQAPAPGRGRGGPAAGGSLYAFDLQTKARTRVTSEPVGGIDGIEPDGRGGLLVTDVIGRRILHVAPSGTTRVIAQLSGGGADFGFIPGRNVAIVPFLNEHKVEAYDLTAQLQ
jgi:hypothetical protein